MNVLKKRSKKELNHPMYTLTLAENTRIVTRMWLETMFFTWMVIGLVMICDKKDAAYILQHRDTEEMIIVRVITAFEWCVAFLYFIYNIRNCIGKIQYTLLMIIHGMVLTGATFLAITQKESLYLMIYILSAIISYFLLKIVTEYQTERAIKEREVQKEKEDDNI